MKTGASCRLPIPISDSQCYPIQVYRTYLYEHVVENPCDPLELPPGDAAPAGRRKSNDNLNFEIDANEMAA